MPGQVKDPTQVDSSLSWTKIVIYKLKTQKGYRSFKTTTTTMVTALKYISCIPLQPRECSSGHPNAMWKSMRGSLYVPVSGGRAYTLAKWQELEHKFNTYKAYFFGLNCVCNAVVNVNASVTVFLLVVKLIPSVMTNYIFSVLMWIVDIKTSVLVPHMPYILEF